VARRDEFISAHRRPIFQRPKNPREKRMRSESFIRPSFRFSKSGGGSRGANASAALPKTPRALLGRKGPHGVRRAGAAGARPGRNSGPPVADHATTSPASSACRSTGVPPRGARDGRGGGKDDAAGQRPDESGQTDRDAVRTGLLTDSGRATGESHRPPAISIFGQRQGTAHVLDSVRRYRGGQRIHADCSETGKPAGNPQRRRSLKTI